MLSFYNLSNLFSTLLRRPTSLERWLRLYPRIANSIKWQYKFIDAGSYEVPEATKKKWAHWSSTQKGYLNGAFEQAWSWYYKQSDPFNNLNEDLSYPPDNIFEDVGDDNMPPWVKVDEDYAWDLYIRWISMNLITEIGNHFGWSILNYSAEQLQVLFDSAAIMSRRGDGRYFICTGMPSHHNYIKRKSNRGASLIAPPRYTYSFLIRNGILATNRYDTIVNLLQWISDNLTHFYGRRTIGNMEIHWQYRGIPPITRIIEGTTNTELNQFRHWTGGCHGTAGFIRNVLRAVNIPVLVMRKCNHAIIYFTTEGLYIDHGDSPYNQAFKNSGHPVTDLLIDETTFTSWFGTNPDNENIYCEYIGQRARDITSTSS